MLKILGTEILLLRKYKICSGENILDDGISEIPKMWNKYVMILLNIVWLIIFVDYKE